jgi:hypothetical protein
MRTPGILLIVGLCCLPAFAYAQSGAGARFDGTYRLVSSAKVSETYTDKGGNTGICPNRAAGPLTIARGQARYTSETGRQLNGTVGPQGELAMRAIEPGSSRAVELRVNGTVDAAGAARARQLGFGCSYDFVWQK